MSATLDMIKSVVGSSMDFLMDDYTVTVDPQGDNTTYSCRGVVSDDLERHRERGLVVETGERVIILLQAQTPTLTDIQVGDYIEGPTNNSNRSEKSVIKSIVRDPADATWVLAVAP